MTIDFRTELDQLATRMRRHPLVEVLAYEVHPPAAATLIQDVEKEFGSAIPGSVVRMYQALNGASLRWRFRTDLDDAQRRRIVDQFAPFTPAPKNVFTLAGAIEIVPLEDALLHEDYTLLQIDEGNDEFVFDGVSYTDNEFCGMLRIFDAVSDGAAMAFVTQPGRADWKLMWLTDSWVAYDCSRVTWLDDYLRLAIATWGLVSARDQLFAKYKGHQDEPAVFDPQRAAALLPEILSAP